MSNRKRIHIYSTRLEILQSAISEKQTLENFSKNEIQAALCKQIDVPLLKYRLILIAKQTPDKNASIELKKITRKIYHDSDDDIKYCLPLIFLSKHCTKYWQSDKAQTEWFDIFIGFAWDDTTFLSKENCKVVIGEY